MVGTMKAAMSCCRLLCGTVLAISALAQSPAIPGLPQIPFTLDEIRNKLVGNTVIIRGQTPQPGYTVLLEWPLASRQKTQYVPRTRLGFDLFLMAKYLGTTARVVAVQVNALNSINHSAGRTNALGESLSSNETIDPYVDVIIQIDAKDFAMTTGYYSTLPVELESEASELTQRADRELPDIIGKVVYAEARTQLYRPDTTLSDLAGMSALKRLSSAEIPLFEPLRIVTAKFIDPVGVVLKLKFPDGRESLYLMDKSLLTISRKTFSDLLALVMLTSIPSSLKPEDVDGIRHRAIYKGMSVTALRYMLGPPDTENSGSDGFRQMVYGTHLYVYADGKGIITDWHTF